MFKVQEAKVEGKSLVRRRFYLSEEAWSILDIEAQVLDTTPSLLVDHLIMEYAEELKSLRNGS